jgi:hypothetical protein
VAVDQGAIERIVKAVGFRPATLNVDALGSEIDYANEAYRYVLRPAERSPTERRIRLVLRSIVRDAKRVSRLVSTDDPVGHYIARLLSNQAEKHGPYEGLSPPSLVFDGSLVNWGPEYSVVTKYGGETAINRTIEAITVVNRAIESVRFLLSLSTELLDRDALAWSWKEWAAGASAFDLFIETLAKIYTKHFKRPVGYSHSVGSTAPGGPWVRFAVATLEAVGAKNRDRRPYGPESVRSARRSRRRHGERSLPKNLV